MLIFTPMYHKLNLIQQCNSRYERLINIQEHVEQQINSYIYNKYLYKKRIHKLSATQDKIQKGFS